FFEKPICSCVQILNELISRCALITLMYQSSRAAAHSTDEHVALIEAIEQGDEALAVRCMDEHLTHVESSLKLDRQVPSNDISMALA
ncbi:MAG: FCD domain-containing protein, partial [Betaproteobacteria bacterium]|nr:FCD domain-containing protein [Betaproteobacteria bacterium]